MEAAIQILCFLKSMARQGLFLPANNDFDLKAYFDSDCVGCPLTRRSCTGYYINLGGAPSLVSRSSTEEEYRAMTTTVSELLWI